MIKRVFKYRPLIIIPFIGTAKPIIDFITTSQKFTQNTIIHLGTDLKYNVKTALWLNNSKNGFKNYFYEKK